MYAAGDVASVHSDALGRRVRVEHEDAALTMGRAAGRAMAGDPAPYTHLPFFYSDLFDMGYEAVGTLDARLEMVADWKEPFREGVVYYLEERPRARRAAVERLGPGRCRAGADRRAGPFRAGGPARADRIALHRRVAGERPSAMSVADRTKVDSK